MRKALFCPLDLSHAIVKSSILYAMALSETVYGLLEKLYISCFDCSYSELCVYSIPHIYFTDFNLNKIALTGIVHCIYKNSVMVVYAYLCARS